MAELSLSSGLATLLFILSCFCGYRYRHVWKTEGPRWQLWLYGLGASIGLIALGFIPMAPSG